MSISIKDDENPEDLLWAAAAIAAVIGRSPRATFYMLESGRPATASLPSSGCFASTAAVPTMKPGFDRLWARANAAHLPKRHRF